MSDTGEPRRPPRESRERREVALGLSRYIIEIACQSIAIDLDCEPREAERLLILAVELLQRER